MFETLRRMFHPKLLPLNILRAAAFGLCALTGAAVPAAEVAYAIVHDQVIAPDPGPFGVTLSVGYGYGNGALLLRADTGFEPIIYRDWFLADMDTMGKVGATPEKVSHWDTLASGALDGAEIKIWRIENGRFRKAATARVPTGGFQASGWTRALPRGRMLSLATRSYEIRWDLWNRPGAPHWFSLVAIDEQGRRSARSAPLRIESPDKIPRQSGHQTEAGRADLIRHRESPEAKAELPAPATLKATQDSDGTVHLSWTHSGGGNLAGFVLERSETDPVTHRGFQIDLDAPVKIHRGDLVQIEKKFYTSRRDMFTNRVWQAAGVRGPDLLKPRLIGFFPDDDPAQSWRLVPHSPATPVTEPGETYLELTLDRGTRTRIGMATNSGTAQDWYDVLKPGQSYRVEFWAKANRVARARFALTGFHAQPEHRITPITFQVGLTWQKHTATFTPFARDPGKAPGGMFLNVAGPVTLSIDNFRIYQDDLPYLAPVPGDLVRLEEAGVSTLRLQALSVTRRRTYDLEHLTNPPGIASGTRLQATLPGALRLAKTTGTNPWLNIEPHLSRDEWLGLAEYLAAPYDPDKSEVRPWAAKRAAQGRVQPWTESFDRILIELGNETWNRIFAPWTFQAMTDATTGQQYSRGEVYGLWQERIANILRESPWWSSALENKVSFVLGGQEVLPRYGAQAVKRAPSAVLLTTGAYIGGWETGTPVPTENPEEFSGVLTHVLQTGVPFAKRHLEAAQAAAGERAVVLGTYEAGPGYQMNGLNGARVTPNQEAVQERVMKSLAAGTATLDSFLARAVLGYHDQIFYEFGPGQRWRSHAPWYRGGQAYPSWILLGLFNKNATGDFLKTEIIKAPHADLPESRHRVALSDAPLIGIYATRKGDQLALIVVSRRVPGYPDLGSDGVTRVTVDLPIAKAAALREISMTGTYASHNVETDAVRPVEVALPVPADLSRFQVPDLAPGSTRFYVFDGVR